MSEVINFKERFSKFSEIWTPKILAHKMNGEFVWHTHDDCDEIFIVIEVQLKICFRDGKISLKSGECFVVPKVTEHKPAAEEEAHVLLIASIQEIRKTIKLLHEKNGFKEEALVLVIYFKSR